MMEPIAIMYRKYKTKNTSKSYRHCWSQWNGKTTLINCYSGFYEPNKGSMGG